MGGGLPDRDPPPGQRTPGQRPPDREPPEQRPLDPPGQRPPAKTETHLYGNEWAVRILLECILVFLCSL